jgi:hypothetical protein
MRNASLALAGAAASLALAAIPAFGADAEVPDHSLSEFRLGEHFSGEKVSLDQLSGKVVAIEQWGVF